MRASWSFAQKSQGGSVGLARQSAQGWLCRAGQSSGWGLEEAEHAPPRPRAVRPAGASEGLLAPGPAD